jgi:hypothetical protein
VKLSLAATKREQSRVKEEIAAGHAFTEAFTVLGYAARPVRLTGPHSADKQLPPDPPHHPAALQPFSGT